MPKPTIGSLFAGIGGFDLGFERAGFTTSWQVEINEYCRKVLAKHFPHAERYADILECGAHNLKPVDVICGGFPCQDISYAGYGAGLDGSRSGLWFEFARIIRELEPRLVVVENVTALLDRGMGAVLGTLSDLGYDAEWSDVSGCSVGTTHMRRRVFIVAHSNRIDGRAWLRDSDARPFGPLQAQHCFTRTRASQKARLANPSELYGGANGVPCGMDRNRALGNAVVPQIPELIARRILPCL